MAELVDQNRELARRAQRGDFTAFEALVALYEHRIYNLAMRIVGQRQEAEEVVQQTFLSVIEHLEEFREESQFSTWLMRIATNHALALLRKRNRRRTVPLLQSRPDADDDPRRTPPAEFIAQGPKGPEQIAAQRETRRLLARALDELDEKYRLVFLLRDVEGLSTAETAQALRISTSNVKVRLLRARLMLRERLTRVLGDDSTRILPQPNV
ncbi:MAG: sigma-70 family RNA polymerase sigma factor [Thermoguttaceae bacterium]|jgi:RNA polymerase sigma-70 factor (ECF subfamily)